MAVDAVNFQGNVPVEQQKNHKGRKVFGTLAGFTAGGALGGLACDTLIKKGLKSKTFLTKLRDAVGTGEGEALFKELTASAKEIVRTKAFTKIGALAGLAGACSILAIAGIVKAIKNKNAEK